MCAITRKKFTKINICVYFVIDHYYSNGGYSKVKYQVVIFLGNFMIQ